MSKFTLIIFLVIACVAIILISSTPILLHVWQVSNTAPSEADGPLDVAYINFAGEWYGDKGSWILIRLDGAGEFKAVAKSLRKGRVVIVEDSISIGSGIYKKTWKIRSAPFIEEGYWQMQLDDEVYYREQSLNIVRLSA